MNKLLFSAWVLGLALGALPAQAQFNLDGQFVQRAEYRHGQGQLLARGEDPAAFIAHRARLQAAYQKDIFTGYMSVQDIRTWGNAPQVKATDAFLSVHEAWAEVQLGEHWTIKTGRQELNYDNARFLGNLDWALQARAHDFVLAKHEKGAMKLHFGGGYNQDGQARSGNIFTVPNQYKAAQLVRYENALGALHFALLFWNDGRQFVERGDLGQIVRQGIRYRHTLGLPALRYQAGKTTLSGFYYHQLGQDVGGSRIDAYNLSVQLTQQFDLDEEKGHKLRLVAGLEWLSGTADGRGGVNRAYSPLYGTNHLFNGYMDLFFVGGAFENSVGLQDYFLRGRYDVGPRFFAQLDGHLFYSDARVRRGGEDERAYLGTEIDLSAVYVFTEAVSVQAGYSRLLAADTLAALTSVDDPQPRQDWGYLMLIFRPTMKNKFIGILL
jgi:hypothetical protein